MVVKKFFHFLLKKLIEFKDQPIHRLPRQFAHAAVILDSHIPTQLEVRDNLLSVRELRTVSFPMTVKNGFVIMDRGLAGTKWKEAVRIPLREVLRVGKKGLVEYLMTVSVYSSRMIPYVFKNQSIIELARTLYRRRDADRPPSRETLALYVDCIRRYCDRAVKTSPDELIRDIKFHEGRINVHMKLLQNFLDDLREKGRSNDCLRNYLCSIEYLYRANGMLAFRLLDRPRKKTYTDTRIPTREEIQRLLLHANLRDKVLLSLLLLTGLREGTIVKLKVGHVLHDLQAGILPLHMHIAREETKGGYAPYDSFYGTRADPEPVQWLKEYLSLREKGTEFFPPEPLNVESPLIRNGHARIPRPVTTKLIFEAIHALYFRAGVIEKSSKKRYELRIHSLRKWFKTQMIDRGVAEKFSEYFMGHKLDTYSEVRDLGVERLRQIYDDSEISLRPQTTVGTRLSEVEHLRSLIQAIKAEVKQELLNEAESVGQRI